jgi:predicted transcriptional regulator
MDILTVLRDGPLGPTRLARTCNLPFDRVGTYLGPLVVKGMVRREIVNEHESFQITTDGLQLLNEMERVLGRLAA